MRILTATYYIIVLATLTGCGDSSVSSRGAGAGGRHNPSSQQRGEILLGTMETLFNLEEYELGQAQQLVVSRLNQWARGQPIKTPWQREVRLDDLPAKVRQIRWVESLGESDFLYDHDFDFLREAVWMHRIGSQVRAEMGRTTNGGSAPAKDEANRSEKTAGPLPFVGDNDPDELRLAMRLFDWTIKNVQLEEDGWPETSVYKLPRNWHTPYETVLLGRGTASDRAWVFMLLARQQGLDVVMLGLSGGENSAVRPGIPALLLSRGDGDTKATDLYLFDPSLGLPIPAAEGGRIATLAEVAANDSLLRALDLDAKRPYAVKAADLQEVAVLVEASPGYLSRRMRFLEASLSGNQRVVLSHDPSAVESRIAQAKHVRPKVALWPRPYETYRLRLTEDESLLAAAQAELYPLQGLAKPVSEAGSDRKTIARREESQEWATDQKQRGSRARVRVPLGVGRMLQLAGKYDHETGALRYLTQAMASEPDQGEILNALLEELRRVTPRPDEPATQQRINELAKGQLREIRRSDQAAKLWIGQIKVETGEIPTAISYFTSWDNPVWKPAVDYSLARVYERQGKLAEAIKLYREDESPQRHGNLLRARKLQTAMETE